MDTQARHSRWLGTGSICFLVIWAALLFFGRQQLFRDPGTLWHTVVGEKLLTNRSMITVDSFSFTFENQPWIAQQWLGECAMALAHRAGGLSGLLVLAATVLSFTYSIVFARLRLAGVRLPAAGVLVVIVIAASSYHFHPRPHLASILGMAVCYVILCEVESGRRRPLFLVWLIPLFIVWTNLHGGVSGGILSAGIVIGCWMVLLLVGVHGTDDGPRVRRRIVSLLLLLGLCAAAVLANPYGLDLPRVWFDLMRSDVVAKIMSEHGPIEWASTEAVTIGLLAVCYFAVLGTAWTRKLRITWLLPAIWLLLSFSRIRHGPLFAVLAGLTIAEMLPYSSLGQFLAEPQPKNGSRPMRIAPVAIFASCFAWLLQSQGISAPLMGANWASLSQNYWPVKAVPQLRQAIAESGDPRVFNKMTFGGYLIYAVPEAKVFIDDRCELYGDDFLMQYESLMRNPKEFDLVAGKWPFGFAFVSARSKLAAYLANHADWQELYKDDTSSLYARRQLAP